MVVAGDSDGDVDGGEVIGTTFRGVSGLFLGSKAKRSPAYQPVIAVRFLRRHATSYARDGRPFWKTFVSDGGSAGSCFLFGELAEVDGDTHSPCLVKILSYSVLGGDLHITAAEQTRG